MKPASGNDVVPEGGEEGTEGAGCTGGSPVTPSACATALAALEAVAQEGGGGGGGSSPITPKACADMLAALEAAAEEGGGTPGSGVMRSDFGGWGHLYPGVGHGYALACVWRSLQDCEIFSAELGPSTVAAAAAAAVDVVPVLCFGKRVALVAWG